MPVLNTQYYVDKAVKEAVESCIQIALDTPYRSETIHDDAIATYEREIIAAIIKKFGLEI